MNSHCRTFDTLVGELWIFSTPIDEKIYKYFLLSETGFSKLKLKRLKHFIKIPYTKFWIPIPSFDQIIAKNTLVKNKIEIWNPPFGQPILGILKFKIALFFFLGYAVYKESDGRTLFQKD